MDVQALLTPDAGAPLGQSRAHVLDLLRAAGSPAGVKDIADQAGLHPNTARFHLDALVDAGLAARAPKERTTPGRPSMAYRAVAGGETMGRRGPRPLAPKLPTPPSGLLPQPREAAREAGPALGRDLTP